MATWVEDGRKESSTEIGTYIRLRQLRNQLLLVRKRLLRLPRADHRVEQPGQVLFQPREAALELARLPRGDQHEPEAQVRERGQAGVRAGHRRRAVEVVRPPELLDLAHRLVRVAPVRVLRRAGVKKL